MSGETYTYHFDGTVATKTDRNGTVFTYSNYNVFKNAGMIQAVNGENTQTLTFVYDKMNNLTYESDSNGENPVSYTYDFLGRLVEKDHVQVVNTYTYNSLGSKTSLVLNRRDVVSGNLYSQDSRTFIYDIMNRMSGITAFGKTGLYMYDVHNQVSYKELGVIKTSRTRNEKGLVTNDHTYQMTSITESHSYYDADYTYNFKQNLVSEHLENMLYNVSYTYDGADRLLDVNVCDNESSKTIAFYYDYSNLNNSMLFHGIYVDSASSSESIYRDYSYSLHNHINGLNWVYENDVQTELKIYESDNNGNYTRDGNNYRTYDLFNRMTSYTRNNATTTYTYTASGLRESKTSDGVQTFFVWDDGNMVAEYVVSESGNEIVYKNLYAYGADGIAFRKTEDGAVYTYNTNYRGDVISVINDTQNVVLERVYDGYGMIVDRETDRAYTDPFGYRGEYHDAESGYIYLRNRYLDPTTGRFITEDPIRDGLNWFIYCENNPIKLVDPWGLKTSEEMLAMIKKYGPVKAYRTYELSNVARTAGENYANAFRLERSWDNESDAYRHFYWNVLMTRELGYDVARTAANNHEIYALKDLGWSRGYSHFKMNQATLMDLWNNETGRNMAINPKYKNESSATLFYEAKEQNLVILNAEDTYKFLGVTEYVNSDWTVNVYWNTENSTITFKKQGLPDLTLRIGA